MDPDASLNPGDLVRHNDFSECLGVVIRCYTKSHRPLTDEYEIFWSPHPSWVTRNPTIEPRESLILISQVNS